MKDYKELFFEAYAHWEKKRGLIISCIAVLSLYFLWLKGIINESNKNVNFAIINIWIPIALVLVVFISWVVTTNRFSVPKSGDLTTALFLYVDEENAENKIRRIAKNSLDDLKTSFPNIKIILKPINFLKSKSQLTEYLNKHSQSWDAAIFAKVDSGKTKDSKGNVEEIITIKDITFSGKFNFKNRFKIFKTTVSLTDDLNIRNINKNWSYIENNSYYDKLKIKQNFYDAILFFSGIYLIYQKKPQKALQILKSLQSKEDSKAIVSISKKSVVGNERFISASRLNQILINLFITSSSSYYNNNDVQSAYNILKDCEEMFDRHPLSFDHFICLARFSYDLGKIDEAKNYTQKAKTINKHKTEIYLNEGFFAILNGNDDEVSRNYKELGKVYVHGKSSSNFTEIISWLETEKSKSSSDKILFEFAIGCLNYFYSDQLLGRKILKKIDAIKLKKEYPKVHDLMVMFLTKGKIKSPYHRKYAKKNKKKKR